MFEITSLFRFKLVFCAILSVFLLSLSVTSFHAQTRATAVQPRNERWREDIRFYARELPQRHKNLFFQLPRNEFERETENLVRRIPKLSDSEIYFELMRITALIGDGHTSVGVSGVSGFSRFPISIERFREGWFVTRAAEEYRLVLGARLVKIGDVKVEKAEVLLGNLISADNAIHRRRRMRFFLIWKEALQVKGILKKAATGRFAFLDRKGKQFSINLRAISEQEWEKIQWQELLIDGKKSLSAKNPNQNYWFEYLPAARTLYLAYNQCANDPDKPFDKFVEEVFAAVDRKSAEKFIVDLRRNAGGNSEIIKSLYTELEKRPQFLTKGKLFVLVGSGTFSSAFINAVEMRDRLNAIWVGTPPSERPTNYGEVQKFELPGSKIEVAFSTKFFELVKNSNLPYVPVDIVAEQTFSHYRKGRDAALQAALSYKPK